MVLAQDPYAKPYRVMGIRFRIWLHRKWRHLPEPVQAFFRIAEIVVLGEAALLLTLYGFSYLVALNILQLPIVVSFGVVELFAFLLARYFLRERHLRLSIMEYMAVAGNLWKYAHLIHYTPTGVGEGYPKRPSYILNTVTNQAYWVPTYLREMARVGAIQTVPHDTEDELYQFFRDHRVGMVRRDPQGEELSLGERWGRA